MIVRSRAPLRLGFAGGGTDVSPYCDKHGGCILNATIDRFAYAVIEPLSEKSVHFISEDGDKKKLERFPLGTELSLQEGLILHQAVYRHFVDEYNNSKPIALRLTTFCDAPVGSGLGSSSAMVVAMIHAFAEFLGISLDDYAMAQMAYQIERKDCCLQGGHQDQYSAAFGGFNFMEFRGEGDVLVHPLRVRNWVVAELEASLVLFYSGISRQSAKIIDHQRKNVKKEERNTLDALEKLKQEANDMRECLLRGDIYGLVEIMRAGWESKKRTSSMVSTPEVEEIYNVAYKAGALAGKVSGAGGGGFMMFYVPTERRMDVVRALRSCENGQVSNCHFVIGGSQAWVIQ